MSGVWLAGDVEGETDGDAGGEAELVGRAVGVAVVPDPDTMFAGIHKLRA